MKYYILYQKKDWDDKNLYYKDGETTTSLDNATMFSRYDVAYLHFNKRPYVDINHHRGKIICNNKIISELSACITAESAINIHIIKMAIHEIERLGNITVVDVCQPEYCDCDGFCTGVCRERIISTLVKEVDTLKRRFDKLMVH